MKNGLKFSSVLAVYFLGFYAASGAEEGAKKSAGDDGLWSGRGLHGYLSVAGGTESTRPNPEAALNSGEYS